MNTLLDRKTLNRLLPGSLVLICGIGLAGTLIATTPKPPQAEAEERIHPVSVQVIEPDWRAPAIGVYGRIEAAASTELTATLSAPVLEVAVREGDWVEAGTLLVQLDASQARLDYRARQAETRQARAELASLQADAELTASMAREQETLADLAVARTTRIEELFERRMVARALLDEVREDAARTRMDLARYHAELADFPNRIQRQEAAVARAEVAEERSRIDLERTRIRAPFDGPVLAVHVARSNQVQSGTPLLRMADADSFEVRATLPNAQAGRLRQQLATAEPITATAQIGGASQPLILQRLASAQRNGRTGTDAFFRLDGNPTVELGRVVELQVTLPAEPDLVALPVQAIYDNDRIYRIEQGRLQAVEVEVVGSSQDEAGYRMLVRAAQLRAGQQIITTQLPQAMNGLRVAPVSERLAARSDPESDPGTPDQATSDQATSGRTMSGRDKSAQAG